jgi:protein gp37
MMAETSKIEWTDATFNPWIGCTKVSPACDHCYAERSTPARTLGVAWGPQAERRRTSAGNWAMPLRWEHKHETFFAAHGRRQRVFCASLADVFDNQVPHEWREDLFELIYSTPNLDWLLLTKRIGNVRDMLPVRGRLPSNVWLGVTACNQPEADRDIPKLLAAPARVRFLSIEPMLGSIDLRLEARNDIARWDGLGRDLPLRRVDWVICGGESGPEARPMHPDWARGLRDQCAAAGVPFLFKQWGEWAPPDDIEAFGKAHHGYFEDDPDDGGVRRLEWQGPVVNSVELRALRPEVFRVGKKAGGRLLDGVEHNGFPS